MAASPRWKVFNPSGEYVASCKHPEDAGMIVSGYGKGATIRDGHTHVVWREGAEEQPAGESYDNVQVVCNARGRTGEKAPELAKE